MGAGPHSHTQHITNHLWMASSLHFAPENPEDGEMCLLVPAHPGCLGQSPESCKMVVCMNHLWLHVHSKTVVHLGHRLTRIMFLTHRVCLFLSRIAQKVVCGFLWNLGIRCLQCLTLLLGWQEGHLADKNEWWGADVIICLEQSAN